MPEAPTRTTVALRAKRTEEVTGVAVPFADALDTLIRLGCSVIEKTEASAKLAIPTHRPDLTREIDLVEEVIRIQGMDTVPAVLPAIRASRDVGGREDLARRAREVAVGLGLSEALTYGFTDAKTLATLGAPSSPVILKNPLAEHHSVMRTTLLPGLFDAVRNARRHGVRDVRQFTIGAVFLPSAEAAKGAGGRPSLPHEELRVGILLAGDRPEWLVKPSAVDVWDIKGYVAAFARRLAGTEAVVTSIPRAEAPAHLHPRGAASIVVGGRPVGVLGPLHPDAVSALALDGDVLVAELDLDAFASLAREPKYAAIPRFPASARDVALVVPETVRSGEVRDVVEKAAGPLAREVTLFDRFTGGSIPEGSVSLAFHVVYRHDDRTLTDAEVDAAHAAVLSEVASRFGATVRGAT